MNAKIIITLLLIIIIIILIIFFNANHRESKETAVFDSIIPAGSNMTSGSNIPAGVSGINSKTDTYKIKVKGVITKQILFTGVDVNIDAAGQVDNQNQGMQIEMNVSIPFSGTESSEMYLIGGDVYRKQSGEWIKTKLTETERAYVWDKNNFLKRDDELMNSSVVEFAGNETINGVSLSVVKITPGKELLKNYVAAWMEQFSDAVPEYRNLPDASDIEFKNVTITYRLKNDTRRIVKEDFRADAVMAGDNYVIRISSEIYDYNKPVDINPPV
jgi:hypothetical protein